VLKTLCRGLCELVYPPHCSLCKKHLEKNSLTEELCPRCRDAIILNTPPFCPKCSRHLVNTRLPRCRDCSKSKPVFDFAWAACPYRPPLSDLICRFKYNQKTSLRRLFSGLMINFIETHRLDIRQFDLIVPVPLFHSRLRERGYNQSRLLAEPVGQKYKIPLSDNTLARVRETGHQALLSEKERWTNIRGAFRIKRPDKIQGKNILIVDDLLTTGATASEAARGLKDAGAQTVGVFTLAITE
jgi:ComF family protein